METDLSSEAGPAGRLFKACVDLFWALAQRVTAMKFEQRQRQALRTEFGRFYFWGEAFHPYSGQLDALLASSSRLRNRVLAILVEMAELLCHGKSGLFALVSHVMNDEKLKGQQREVLSLAEGIRETIDEDLGSSSGSDSDSGASINGEFLQDIILALRSRNNCLVDLTGSLDRPAPDPELAEPEISKNIDVVVSTPGEMWTRRILDMFPSIDLKLASRLGEANWQRYQKVAERLGEAEPFEEAEEDVDSLNNESEDDEVGELPDFTKDTKSSADPSSIFSSVGRKPSTTGTSISDQAFDYAFPLARRRHVARDLRSQATYTSVLSNDEGERGWLRIPAMPEGAESGKAFRCTVCGGRQEDIINRTEWKKHVFRDLEPYICTSADCRGGIAPYSTRKAWADHEFSVHRVKRFWQCGDCSARFEHRAAMLEHAYSSHGNILMRNQLEILVNAAERRSDATDNSDCPFCGEAMSAKPRAFAMHVGKHMEEIALTVLPRDTEFEEDRGSIKSDESERKDPPALQGEGIGPAYPNRFWNPSLDHFNLLATVGKGNFAKVVLAKTKTDKKVFALKVFKKDFMLENDEVRSSMTEMKVLRKATRVQHPFISTFYGTFQTADRVYFILEYIPGGDLMWHIQRKKFPVSQSKFYAAEVCLVLRFLHEQNVLYRDMKLDNIMLASDGHIKLIDFGLCKSNFLTPTRTFCGTPEFMAPEILLDKPYGFPVDWWAFGVLIYQMIFSQSPFRGDDEDEIYEAILAEKCSFPIQTPKTVLDIVQKLLTSDPEVRLGSGGGAEDVMNHEFFSEIDFDALYRKGIAPPMIPSVESERDIRHFDDEFTAQAPQPSPVLNALTEVQQKEFEAFSSNNSEIYLGDWF